MVIHQTKNLNKAVSTPYCLRVTSYHADSQNIQFPQFRYLLGSLSSSWGFIFMEIVIELLFMVVMSPLCGLNSCLAVKNLNIHDKPSDYWHE